VDETNERLRYMKYKLSLVISFFVLNAITSFSQTLQLPYNDVGACPFECCTYREWVANKDTVIYKEMREGSPIAFRIKRGVTVTGITGVVITTKAGQVKALRNTKLERISVKAGDILYTLTYLGEGYYKVWYKGEMTTESFYEEPGMKVLSEPESIWWVKIKNRRGQVGWTKLPENFNNMDACGTTQHKISRNLPQRRADRRATQMGQ
jgi:hypothetical protein